MKRKTGYTILFSIILMVCLGLSSLIPFYFESQSIYYKFGVEKIFLRTGKIIGLFLVVLFVIQIVLIARLKWLDRIYGLDQLWRFHRFNGIVMSVLILFHAFFIFGAEGFGFYPFEKRYWPEFLGIATAVLFLGMVGSALLKIQIRLPYHWWFTGHRIAAPLIGIMIFIHVSNVSESFEATVPFIWLCVLFFIAFLLAAAKWKHAVPFFNYSYTVKSVASIARDVWEIKAEPEDGQVLKYFPGQFVFLATVNSLVPSEAHPFTIASAPQKNENLEFVIKDCGDFTHTMGLMKKGDTLSINGPYGRFSYLMLEYKAPVIMIAGGIGITPFLSMLRHMTGTESQPKVKLIWSNQTKDQAVFDDELSGMQNKMSDLVIEYIYTREENTYSTSKRIDFDYLNHTLHSVPRTSHVYICGPRRFSNDVKDALMQLGFSKARVYTESFVL